MRNNLTTSFFFILVGLTLTLIASPATAVPQSDPIGTVVAVRGVVNAVAASGKSRQLAIKAPIFGEDSLDTGNNGRIQLLFTDNTIMSLGQNTKMKIAEYRWSETAAKEAAMKTQVKEGSFRVLGGAITKAAPKNFTTETPSATIGIRGSSYAGNVTEERLTVVLLGGKGVNIFNNAGMVPLTKVGYGTVVNPGQAPMKSFKFSPQELQNLSSGLTRKKKKKTSAALSSGEGEQENGTEGEPQEHTGTNDENGGQDTQPAATEASNAGGGESPAGDSMLVNEISPDNAPAMKDLPPTFAPVLTSNPQSFVVPLDIPPPPPPTETTLTLNLTPSIPTNGIEGFTGWISGTSVHDGITESISDPFYSEVNWYNRKFIGFVDTMNIDPNSTDNTGGGPVFFFGSTNSDGTIASARVVGSDMIWDDILGFGKPARITGSGTTGQFLALDSGLAFGFGATGYTYELATQTYQDTWVVSGSGVSDGIDPAYKTAPTGSVTWQGFVTGLAEDIADPGSGRHLLMNSTSSTFTMIINRDAGTINGNFAATDGSATINVTNIGGANGSAYVNDDHLIAVLSGNVNSSYNLLANSNYLSTVKPDAQFASYAEWGIWAAAYVDTSGSPNKVYDIHQPGTYWVAGVPTASPNFVPTSYTYSGKAYGAKITTDNLTPVDGTTNIAITFTTNTGNGTINAGSVINAGDLSLGFTGTIINGTFNIGAVTGATSGIVNGAFFGPAANSVAGNFTAAITGTSSTYIGIFGGNRP